MQALPTPGQEKQHHAEHGRNQPKKKINTTPINVSPIVSESKTVKRATHMSRIAAVRIETIPLSISGFSLIYMTPKIPATTAQSRTSSHSQAKMSATVAYSAKRATISRIRAVMAAREPTATA